MGAAKVSADFKLTRENIASGAALEHLRRETSGRGDALEKAGFRVRSETEINACCEAFLTSRPPQAENIWVFGYGSLMWNPAIKYREARNARIFGYRRSFCLLSVMGRGSPEQPGLMLALDRGGSCQGRAYQLPARRFADEVHVLWRREMMSHAYKPVWLRMHTGGGVVDGFTFVIAHDCLRYRPKLSLDEQVALICSGRGHLGSSRDYLESTAQHMAELGLKDRTIATLVKHVRGTAANEGNSNETDFA